MTNKATTGGLERQALELLPWYVNGTLVGEERELVGRQVLASLTCRKELERLRHLQQLIQRDDAEAAATDREFERLMARIHASDAPTPPAAARSPRASGWFPFALAATVVAAVAASLWWGSLPPSASSGPYETLTSPQPVGQNAAYLRILFAPGVNEPEQRELLASHGLTTVAPPAEDGVITLAFPPDADRHAIVAALKKDPRIRLVTTPPEAGGP
jgi:hypothetical protein